MRNIIIASTSTIHGSGYLEYMLPELTVFFKNVSTILFIPYARPSGISHDGYTQKVAEAFSKINKNVKGIHEFENPVEAIQNAEGIFTGGGNTFVLTYQLYKNNITETLQKVVKKWHSLFRYQRWKQYLWPFYKNHERYARCISTKF